MTAPLSKFPVYWTRNDIDRKVRDIDNYVAKRSTKAGSSNPAFGFAAGGAASVATALMGDYVYYQRLLSARKARDELEKKGSGSIFDFFKWKR